VVRVGDRVRALILKVVRENRGPQIFLSRAHPDFMKKLFAQEVPEIYDGIIEIKAAARDPGSRAKIGVISHDSSIDPVGACVGMKGSRVQAVVQEMQGEKIDIIPWSPDLATFVVNALQPATVARVVIDEEESRIEVVVPDDQLSLAIGRRGQNVRLASQLTGSAIDIMTEADASEKRQREFIERSEMFQQELDVDETLAQLLVAEGFGRAGGSGLCRAGRTGRHRRLRRGAWQRIAEPCPGSARAPRGSGPRGAAWAGRRGCACRAAVPDRGDAGDAGQGQYPDAR
jgi:N utilization substance protein A